ncbi:MAG: DNA internalization-related competence protein ComEC/Rec2 [Firmicutes bacterium]|nr:DNA internalization-related competence protein ComEC/Rec2 [Bacillota bacterium]
MNPDIAFVTIFYIIGILSAYFIKLDIKFAVILLILSAAFTVIFINKLRIRKITIFLLFLASGIFMEASSIKINSYGQLSGYQLKEVSVRGMVADMPGPADDGVSFTLKASEIIYRGINKKVSAGIKIFSPVKDISYGNILQVSGLLEYPPGIKNPGEFDYAEYLKRQGVHHILFIKDPGGVKILEKHRGSPVLRTAYAIRCKLGSTLAREFGEKDASIMEGIAFGTKSQIPDEIIDDFQKNGTFHILAASGLNVGIVSGFLLLVFNFLKLSKKTAVIVSIPIIILYTILTGLVPSMIRASVMGIIMLVGYAIDKEGTTLNCFFLAALLMLFFVPDWLFDTGFQLSFLSVAGIIFVTDKLKDYMKNLPGWLRLNLSICLASQAMITPLLALYFNQISLISPFANLVIVPLSGILLPLILLSSILGAISLSLAAPFAGITHFLLCFMMKFSHYTGSLKGASLAMPTPSVTSILLYYAFIASILLFIWKKINKAWFARILFCLILFSAFFFLYEEARGTRLEVTFLNVGEGECAFLSLPGGEKVLIDAGPVYHVKTKDIDYGKKVVVPYLKRKGVKRLDLVVITHPHSDHAGGMRKVLENFPAGLIMDTSLMADSKDFKELEFFLEKSKIPLIKARQGMKLSFNKDVTIEVLNPPGLMMNGTSNDTNNNSIVIKLSDKNLSFLFCADIQKEAEEEILENCSSIKSDVMLTAHQGSADSANEDFLKAVGPSFAVISVGRNNNFNHPSPVTIELLKKMNVKIYRTDKDGAVIFTEKDGALEVKKCN